MLDNFDYEKYITQAVDAVIEFAPGFLLAIAILWIGMKIVKKLSSLMAVGLEKAGISDSIRPFMLSIVSVILKVTVIFIVVSIIGINLSGFVAILAAAGFAVGMALQGSLGNFASGMLILVFKPYQAGDWIMIDERFGQVEEIQIFNTIVTTPGHKTLIIPNSQITDGIVTNFSKTDFIRLELNITMPYNESFPRVKKIITEALIETPKMLTDPPLEIGIDSFDSHNVILAVRPYCHPDDYWSVTYAVNERMKAAFSANNVKVAYSEGVEMGDIGE